jgi:uncharacterized membrane protein YccC
MRFLDRVNWRHGLKTALAAGICLWLVRLFALKQGYWACVSTIVVMQSETGATMSASRDRVVGTAIGVLVGCGTAYLWHGHLAVYAVAVLICMALLDLTGLKSAGRLAGVAATIVLLVPSTASHQEVAWDRFLEVSLGILVALAVSQAVWRETAAAKV